MTAAAEREVLSLESTPAFAGGEWSTRLPVRAELISVSKQAVIRERVVVRRHQVEELERVDARLLREELRTSTSGPVEIGEPDSETTRTDEARD